MQYEKVINGLSKYITSEMYPALNDWQELVARLAVTRALNNQARIKDALQRNAFIKTFAIMDENGDVDVEGLMTDMKELISTKGKVDIHIPMFGKFSFTSADVDKLYRMMTEA
jgi:hypothetical protein